MTYHFKNIKTGKIVAVDLKVSEYDAYKAAHPELERYHDTAPAVTFNGRTFGGLDSKTDNTWKEVLSKIAEKVPASPLADNYGKKKSTKEVKTREVIKKHAERVRKRLINS